MDDKLYECLKCGKKASAHDRPSCCGEPMEVCTMAADAEHARPMEPEEPCDDGRSG